MSKSKSYEIIISVNESGETNVQVKSEYPIRVNEIIGQLESTKMSILSKSIKDTELRSITPDNLVN